MLVRQAGWTHTQTAWAFSIAIFSLGVSAAWAGNMLPRLGPRWLALAGSLMFSGGYLIASAALHLGSVPLFYLGLRSGGRSRHRAGLRDAGGDRGQVVPRPQGTGHRYRGHGFRRRGLSAEQGPGPVPDHPHGRSPAPGLLLARHRLRLHPGSQQPRPQRSPPILIRRRRGGDPGIRRARLRRPLPAHDPVRRHVDRLLLQHLRRDLGDQLSVRAPSGDLGPGGCHHRADHPGRVRRHPHRRELDLQRPGAPVLGTALRPASAGSRSSGSSSPARWSSSGFS